MYSAVVHWTVSAGPGVKTVTGVVDVSTGAPIAFAGKVFLPIGGRTLVNVLGSTATGVDGMNFNAGADGLTSRGSGGTSDRDEFLTPTLKIASAGNSSDGSFMALGANAFFGGDQFRLGHITAVRAGEFDVTLTQNDVSGDTYMILVLGGDDLTVTMVSAILGAHTYATAPALKGFIRPTSGSFGTGGGNTTGAGGQRVGIGWSTKDSGIGTALTWARSQDNNSRYLSSAAPWATIGVASTSPGNVPDVAYSDASFLTGASGPGPLVALSGEAIRMTAGVQRALPTTGLQTVACGINAIAVILAAVGLTEAPTVSIGESAVAIGYIGGGRQGVYWGGETRNNATPVTGARIVRNDAVLLTATAAGAATVFPNVAIFRSLSSHGAFNIEWTSRDATPFDFIWLAIGTEAQPSPQTTYQIRRLRRFPLPFNRSYWAFVSRLELLMQSGDAPISGQGSDPLITLRFSPDGGRTWGDIIEMPAGTRGDYEFRPTLNQLGRFRNGLCEVSATDPLLWYWLNVFIDVEFGGA